MHTSNVEPRRQWSKAPPPRWTGDLDREVASYECLSCGSFAGEDEPFCVRCRRWSRQIDLTPWDDLGEAD